MLKMCNINVNNMQPRPQISIECNERLNVYEIKRR